MTKVPASPYVMRHDRRTGTDSIVHVSTHPNPNAAEQRAVSHAKRLARAEAVGPDNRYIHYTAYAIRGAPVCIYTSAVDRTIQNLIDKYPIDRRSYPYARTTPVNFQPAVQID